MRKALPVTNQKNMRWAFALFAIAGAFLAAFYVIPGLLATSDGEAESGQCIPPHQVDLDHGEHDGQPWRIRASIEKIEKHDRCPYWFLKVGFTPEDVPLGSWIEGWGIPAGGN